jgi:CheY-like chemotaxis protein
MRTILVIEDNTEIRENTVELLELNNYRVISAKNGYFGFELARRHRPDIVLCDMMMPDTDGRQFLQMAKSHPDVKDIPLIFFSAGSPAQEIKKKLLQEADYYLQKPFGEQDLLRAITNTLQRVKP